MKKNRTIIAACILSAFATSPAMARDTWQFHEIDWNKVRSYATTPISEDSLNSWGAWGDFVEPAAGLPNVASMPGIAGSDPYRTTPNATSLAADVCRAGDWCGYAVFANQQWSNDQTRNKGESSEGYGYSYSGPMAGLFGLTLTPNDPTAVTVNGGSGSGMVSWRLAALTSTPPILNNSGTDLPATFGNWYWYFGGQGGLNNFYAERYSNTDNGNTSAYDGSYVYGFPQDYYYYWGLPTSNKEVAVGWFGRYIESYVNGQDEESYWNDQTQTYGYYVAGIATPQAYLDSQRAGNVVATYSGNSMDFSGYQTSVNMTVNFGNGTWNGSWNNGADGYVYTNTASNGATHLQGQVGFNASGTISGANINSTALSANDGIVTGRVQGTFYGQTAGSIGGVSDIVKTNTATMTPTTAAHTAVFLVNKVENTPR